MAEKPAPPRNKIKESSPLYKNSRALELQGRDPGFVYENFSTDPEHPSYVGKRMVRHERGNAVSGFVMVEPWQVVQATTDADVKALDPRTDQGAKVDTVQRYGRQITCRIPVEEYDKYRIADQAYQAMVEKQLFEPDKAHAGPAKLTTVVRRDEEGQFTATDLLEQVGHPMPGARGGV